MILNKYPLMAEEGGETPAPSGGVPPQEPSGLPSEQPPKDVPTSFEIKPEDLQDGKYQGKWASPTEMAEHIKNIEDKYANLQRDVKNTDKQTLEEIELTAKELKTKQAQEDTIRSLVPQFLENGMALTEEMTEALKATGLSETDIKLGAYEFKEALDKNASYVGGMENYNIIMDYHAQNMTPEEKVAFNNSIQNPNNSEALMIGLQTIYERNIGLEQPVKPADRVRGTPVQTNAIKPYETKAELLRDKRYADSKASSASDKARFKQRLNATPDKVWLS